MYDFTFNAIDLKITDNERTNILNEILALDNTVWHYNSYRGCSMLPILSNNGNLGPVTSAGMHTDLCFTNAASKCPTLINVLETKIFPIMNVIGRVTILKTNKKTSLNLHIDSNKGEIGSRQHKFRFVISGEIDKLYFLDKDLNKIYIPGNHNTYIMDGTHPHALDESDEEKITLCIGAPWNGQPSDEYNKILQESLYQTKISRPEFNDKWLHPTYRKN